MTDLRELLETFSKLNVSHHQSCSGSSSENVPVDEENCPICQTQLARIHFIPHVYNCIKSLESSTDESLDYNYDYPENEQKILDSYTPPTVCPEGITCLRRNRQHFLSLYHPCVACPVCSRDYQIYDMEEHLLECCNEDAQEVKIKESDIQMPKLDTVTNLSMQQMIGISQFVLQKISTQGLGNSNPDEPSIDDLLETFGKLGFTPENLKQIVNHSKSTN